MSPPGLKLRIFSVQGDCVNQHTIDVKVKLSDLKLF